MESPFHKHDHKGIYIAIAISTIISLVGSYFITLQPKMNEIGGRENYKLYKELIKDPKYQENIRQSLLSQKEMMENDQAPTTDGNQAQTGGTLTQEEIASIVKDVYVEGETSANIIWVEYSDLECPFCKKLHDSGAIENMQKKYGDDLAVIFKHYPLPFHPTALPAAQNAECVGEISGGAKFYAFVDAIFKKGTPTQDVIDSALAEIKVDAKKVATCVASSKYQEKVTAHQIEGQNKFGINGTPGNVLINTKTGKYEIISGALPEASFDAAIQRLLAE